MIGYLEGKLLRFDEDRILLLTHQVGYEILLPAVVMNTIRQKAIGDEISLYIYYHQTERQPKPVLIGFNSEAEKEFFQQFIGVGDIGPLKAAKALTLPIQDIARAIESRNVVALSRLKGIGERTAQKIIAALCGRIDRFVSAHGFEAGPGEAFFDASEPVYKVLVEQLGHRPADARNMIAQALKRNSAISTPEELFDELYRGETP